MPFTIKIRYIISQKSSISYIISHNYAKIKTDAYGLTSRKILTVQNVIILASQFLIRIKITTIAIYFKKDVHVNNRNMMYYDRIDISEGIDANKTSESKEYGICHYWYFLDKRFKFHEGFKFQTYVCNGCLDILLMSRNLDDIANLNINGIDYHCNINEISESEAVNLLKNANLTNKSRTL